MGLLFSRECEYALQAVIRLSAGPAGHLMPIAVLSAELNIPAPFLSKILRKLTVKGLLRSSRGPRGGFALANEASTVTLIDVIGALDETGRLEECVLGEKGCSAKGSCVLHDDWAAARERFTSALTKRTLDLMSHNR